MRHTSQSFWVSLALCIFNWSCQSPSSRQPDPAPPLPNTAAGAEERPGGADPVGEIDTKPSASDAIDVVIVSAIGDENKSAAPAQREFFAKLLATIGTKLSQRDGRLALIASPQAALSGVGVDARSAAPLAASKIRQATFELAPKDALLGSIVAGCDKAASALDSTHAAGTIKVCGEQVALPAHSWSWGVEDLKGQLVDFLRPTAKRVYVIVASNDAQLLTATQFSTLAATQLGGRKPVVNAVVPSGGGAGCSDRNKPAPILRDVAVSSGGKEFSFCEPNWASFIDALSSQF